MIRAFLALFPKLKAVIDYSKPVRVFKNPLRGCYSIMQGGAIRASAQQVRLKDATFLVRESGRQRMLQRAKRNVHAYVIGELLDYAGESCARRLEPVTGRSVRYNPYHNSSFVDAETGQPVNAAGLVQFDESGVTYG